MNIVLLLVALFLKMLLSPLLISYNLLRCLQMGAKQGYKSKGFWGIFSGMYNEFNDWCWQLACVIDQLGNVMGKYMWNDLFKKKDVGYSAGDRLDTISYFLGANQHKGTLSKPGEVMTGILDKFEDEHAIKAYHTCNMTLKNKVFDL